MPKYNVNKMRSAGLRYIAVDKSGQAWAFEPKPQRKYDCYWVLPDEFLPIKGMEDIHWSCVLKWRFCGRSICVPIFDFPIDLSWEDEPFDIVENGLVEENDFKIWPSLKVMKH